MSHTTKEMNSDALKKLVTKVIKNVNGSHEDAQAAALQALIQIAVHRNTTVAFNLVDGIKNPTIKKQLRKYFEDHAPLLRKYKARRHVGYKIDKTVKLEVLIAKAETVSFWDYNVKPEKIEWGFDNATTSVTNLLKKCRSNLTEVQFNNLKATFADASYVEDATPSLNVVKSGAPAVKAA